MSEPATFSWAEAVKAAAGVALAVVFMACMGAVLVAATLWVLARLLG